MTTYNLIGRNEYPSTDPQRIGKMDIAYAYMDESLRTIMIILPAEEDTPARVEDELRKRAAAAAAAGPKSVTI
ncbi:MAG: hypothetical protein Q8N51_09060 [Gammaproteobacteria bacterium]|nr:hypothetical protein [Gammaproteobacteria bacterium]